MLEKHDEKEPVSRKEGLQSISLHTRPNFNAILDALPATCNMEMAGEKTAQGTIEVRRWRLAGRKDRETLCVHRWNEIIHPILIQSLRADETGQRQRGRNHFEHFQRRRNT